MNVIALVHDKLPLFGADEDFITMLLANRAVSQADRHTKGCIVELFRRIDENTDTYDKGIIIDVLKDLVYETQTPKLFLVNEGEDFCLNVDLKDGVDFTGFMLIARHAKDGAALSSELQAGTSDDPQSIIIEDLPLPAGGFYKIHALLEHPQNGEAAGNASTLLTDAVLIVKEKIDTND